LLWGFSMKIKTQVLSILIKVWFWSILFLLQGNNILQLDWLSNIVDDSCNENLIVKKVEQQPPSSVNKEDFVQSSSSPTHGNTTMRLTRSKRPRPATFNPLVQPCNSFFTFPLLLGRICKRVLSPIRRCLQKNFLTLKLWPRNKIFLQESPKRKIKQGRHLLLPQEIIMIWYLWGNIRIVRRRRLLNRGLGQRGWRHSTMHGVWYKSGRLYLEYRPTASPNFSSHLHSNSYKILEMRVFRRKDNKNSGILALEYLWRENDPSYGYFSRLFIYYRVSVFFPFFFFFFFF